MISVETSVRSPQVKSSRARIDVATVTSDALCRYGPKGPVLSVDRPFVTYQQTYWTMTYRTMTRPSIQGCGVQLKL
jgi:hypothetical protein